MSMMQTEIERLNAEAAPWWFKGICFGFTGVLVVASIVCVVALIIGE